MTEKQKEGRKQTEEEGASPLSALRSLLCVHHLREVLGSVRALQAVLSPARCGGFRIMAPLRSDLEENGEGKSPTPLTVVRTSGSTFICPHCLDWEMVRRPYALLGLLAVTAANCVAEWSS